MDYNLKMDDEEIIHLKHGSLFIDEHLNICEIIENKDNKVTQYTVGSKKCELPNPVHLNPKIRDNSVAPAVPPGQHQDDMHSAAYFNQIQS